MINIILIILLIFLLVMPFCVIHWDKKDFNNGICPKCGGKLHLFDIDSHGNRGYCCHKCPYCTWIGWTYVDKNYKS